MAVVLSARVSVLRYSRTRAREAGGQNRIGVLSSPAALSAGSVGSHEYSAGQSDNQLYHFFQTANFGYISFPLCVTYFFL